MTNGMITNPKKALAEIAKYGDLNLSYDCAPLFDILDESMFENYKVLKLLILKGFNPIEEPIDLLDEHHEFWPLSQIAQLYWALKENWVEERKFAPNAKYIRQRGLSAQQIEDYSVANKKHYEFKVNFLVEQNVIDLKELTDCLSDFISFKTKEAENSTDKNDVAAILEKLSTDITLKGEKVFGGPNGKKRNDKTYDWNGPICSR